PLVIKLPGGSVVLYITLPFDNIANKKPKIITPKLTKVLTDAGSIVMPNKEMFVLNSTKFSNA
ncbi:hypothetical protein NAI42_10035, partial [Francisella tularensis subsp. holarctica]|nr:hypothetical protein [Francisella tularensis subsp. holarctica]